MSKAIDMTGWKMWEHGVPDSRYTVIRREGLKNGKPAWLVECSCESHTQKIIRGDALRNGNVKSCGCLAKERASEKNSKDITNMRFGKLVALHPTTEREKGSVVWECKCDCGNFCKKPAIKLNFGSAQSCGCLHKEVISSNLIGKKFGRLLVIEKTEKRDNNRNIIWKCQCDCGNYHEASTRYLTNGHVKSCGCLKSYGEEVITKILSENNIIFKKQKTFPNLIFEDSKEYAKFDFWINEKYIVEYDGSQHFYYTNTKWNTETNFIKTQEHDKIKNQYCFDNNIPIIRIPYTHLENLSLEDLMLETSQFILRRDSY